MEFPLLTCCTSLARGLVNKAGLQGRTERDIEVGGHTMGEIWVVNVPGTVLGVAINSLLSSGGGVVLNQGVEKDVLQSIMPLDAERALATSQKMVTVGVNWGATGAHWWGGCCKGWYSQLNP